MKAALKILIKEFTELCRRPNLLAWLVLAAVGFLWLSGSLSVRETPVKIAIAVPPGMAGHASVRTVKDIIGQFSNAKAVIVTQSLDPSTDAQRAGADLLVSKPESWNAADDFSTAAWTVFNVARPGPRQQELQVLSYEIALAIRAKAPWHLVMLNALYNGDESDDGAAAAPIFTPLGTANLAAHWLVPCFLALMTIFFPFLLICNSIARERELGTLDQLLVTPGISWKSFALGKALLPALAAFGMCCILLLAAAGFFGFPVRPGVLPILLLQGAGIISSTALGLAAAGAIENQLQGYFMAAGYLLASILLTGLLFPLSDANTIISTIAPAFPLTWTYEPLAEWMLSGRINESVMRQAAIGLLLQILAFSTIAGISLALARRRL